MAEAGYTDPAKYVEARKVACHIMGIPWGAQTAAHALGCKPGEDLPGPIWHSRLKSDEIH